MLASHGPDTTLAVLFLQMTEGRHCQVHLLDDRRLELLVQVGVAHVGVAQIGFARVGVAQVGVTQISLPQVGFAHTGTAHPRSLSEPLSLYSVFSVIFASKPMTQN